MDETSFGRYRLLGSLGEGGAGQVFRAYDTVTDREVALKVLAPQVAQDATFEQRFRREAHVAARLSEPHVVPIHSYGEIDGRLYVDMRLIAGRDLGSVLAESGPMNPVRAVGIIEQVAYALDAAHSINLVHRDIKPSNILLDRRDFAYLIDFGIAQDVNATRLTTKGAAIGTFAYIAPERLDTGQAGPSSDIYSLACVLYECLTGELPFPGQSIQQQIAGHLSKPPPRPSAVTGGVPQAFDEVIARGMAKNPGQRYPTVIALAEAAREALDRQPRETPPHAMPTELAPTQHAAPVPGPPAPPANAAPSPPGPTRGGGPARLKGTPRAQQLRQPVNFVVPGVLVMIFAAVSMIFAMSVVNANFWPNYILTGIVYLFLWLILTLAFGLVARGCGAGARAVAITAGITCAAALVNALPWADLLREGYIPGTLRWLPNLVFVALIGFGVIAHPPFGWWWSLPASVAGLFGALGYGDLGLSYLRIARFGGYLGGLWLVPLFILGIALCLSRARKDKHPQPN